MIYKLFFLIYKNYLCKIAKQILFTWKIYFWYDHLHGYIIPDATQQEYKKNTSLFAAKWFGRTENVSCTGCTLLGDCVYN